VLFESQPAAILRRHGRAVRAGDGYHPCPAISRRLGGGTRVLDERGGASRTRSGPGVPPRRAAPRGRAAPQPLLGRPARAPARVVPPGLRDRANAPCSPARGVLSKREG